MRISNYPSDALTGSELILGTDVDTSTQTYKTVNFSVNTLKAFFDSGDAEGVASIIFEGAANDDHDGILTSVAAGNDKTYTLPNATGFVALYTADPLGVTIASTPAELNILDGALLDVNELNILNGVTATTAEINYLDITTLGTSQASKAVTSSAGNAVKLTGELQVSYAVPQIILEDTTSSRGDARILVENDLFRIETKANGTNTWNRALDIDATSASPRLTIPNGISVTGTSANIIMNGGDIENAQTVEMNVMTVTAETGTVESGAVNHTDTLSKLITTSGSAGASTLAAPTANVGLVKVLVFQADGGGDMVTTVSNAGWKSSGSGTITFDTIGDACTLVYSGDKWFVSGNNGCVFA